MVNSVKIPFSVSTHEDFGLTRSLRLTRGKNKTPPTHVEGEGESCDDHDDGYDEPNHRKSPHYYTNYQAD